MTTTVYFATNRIRQPSADRPENYTFFKTAPDTATGHLRHGLRAGLTADTVGAIRLLNDLQRRLQPGGTDDLAEGGRNILVFIHGFANSFEDEG